MPKVLVSLILTLLFYSLGFAQNKQNYNWYLGTRAAITWNTPSFIPEPIFNNTLTSRGGMATISNRNGELLFYTNGNSVCNKNHIDMVGSPLNTGDWTLASQPALIIPFPDDKDDRFFYIFYWRHEETSTTAECTLLYAIVDMQEEGGLGAIIEDDIVVETSVITKITAIRHANKRDIWLFYHPWGINQYFATLITSEGVSTSPIVSTTGSYIPNYNSIYAQPQGILGCMISSPDGSKLAIDFQTEFQNIDGNGTVEVSDINNETGIISNSNILKIYNDQSCVCGLGFSPNSSMLYVSIWESWSSSTPRKMICQYDMRLPPILQGGSEMAILNTLNPDLQPFGQLPIGPDGYIYTGYEFGDSLYIIYRPNLRGLACQFTPNVICVDDVGIPPSRSLRRGFPQFIQSYVNIPDFEYENHCFGANTHFWLPNPDGISGVQWFFNDPVQPGASSTDWEPNFIFSSPGTYPVKLVYNYNSGTMGMIYDTAIQNIVIYSPPQKYNFGSSQQICQGETTTLTLSGSQIKTEYTLWRNGLDSITTLDGTASILQFSDLTLAGSYNVIATAALSLCSENMYGTAQITFFPNPQQYDFSQTAEICSGESTQLLLPNSEVGTLYTLFKDGLNFGITLTGTGGQLIFSDINQPGNYTVNAESADHCTAIMNGVAVVSVGVSPIVYDVSGGGSICEGSGLNQSIFLDDSEVGVTYTLFKNGISTLITLSGTGNPLEYDQLSESGIFTFQATHNISRCKKMMTKTVEVIIIARPLPNPIRHK